MDDFDEVFARLARTRADKRNRSHGNALVHNGNAVLSLNGFARCNQVLRICRNLVIDVGAKRVDVVAHAVEQAYAQRDCAHIELFLLDHMIGLMDLHDVKHVNMPFVRKGPQAQNARVISWITETLRPPEVG